jgi:hypothetical protein
MGRLFYLFVCYGRQELRRTMDGGGNNCIGEGLRNGRRKVSIMKEKATQFFLVCNFFLIFVALRLLS